MSARSDVSAREEGQVQPAKPAKPEEPKKPVRQPRGSRVTQLEEENATLKVANAGLRKKLRKQRKNK